MMDTMNTANKNTLVLTLMAIIGLFIYSCQAPYENEELDADKKIPVVNGVLTNLNGLQSFELYYAMPYNDKRKQRLTGAQVSIASSQQETFPLTEVNPGYYAIDKSLLNISVGTAYHLDVILTDGTILKSEPVTMTDTLPIGSIYHDVNIRSSIVKDVNGNYNQVNENGVFIYLKLKQPAQEVYYRAHADYYIHSQFQVHKTSTFEVDKTFFKLKYQINYDTLYDYLEGVSNTEFPTIGMLDPSWTYNPGDLTVNPIFLPADRECRDFTDYTPNTFVQWIFPVDLISTSRETYEYYQNVQEQLDPEDRIFDPIPEQLFGNIYNETDPNSPSLGLFDVVAVNRRYYAVYVHEAFGYRSYQGRFYSDTVFHGGKYPNQIHVDTTFLDTIFPEETVIVH